MDNDEQTSLSLEEKLNEQEAANFMLQELYKRTLADFENYKRRKDAENKDLVEFAREVAVTKLLPTLDSLEQALKHKPDGLPEAWSQGVDALLLQLSKALAELGVEKIESVGKKFDPELHEAVKEVEGEGSGQVAEEFSTGYKINGKVIRPSQVSVIK